MKLTEKLLEMQIAVDSIIKDAENKTDHYDYTSDTAVLKIFRPLMNKHKLLLILGTKDVRVHEGTTRSGTTRFLTEVFYTFTWMDVESGENIHKQEWLFFLSQFQVAGAPPFI